jgi:hypothetical protein
MDDILMETSPYRTLAAPPAPSVGHPWRRMFVDLFDVLCTRQWWRRWAGGRWACFEWAAVSELIKDRRLGHVFSRMDLAVFAYCEATGANSKNIGFGGAMDLTTVRWRMVEHCPHKRQCIMVPAPDGSETECEFEYVETLCTCEVWP